MRGQIFTLENKRFFTMGEAESHDKSYRTINKNWWKQELPDRKEYGEAYKNLEKYNYIVDYVISHSIPSQYLPSLSNGVDEFYSNHLTDFFDEIELKLDYKHWFSGHYHCDKTLATNSKITLIYNDIIKL